MMNHNEDSNRDLLALYEMGEITAEELASSMSGGAKIPDGIKPFANKDDEVYLSLNVLEQNDDTVKFRIGIQIYFGMEFLGVRNQVTSEGVRTRQGTRCKYRTANGVTLVSMAGPLEWCREGYYYSLFNADYLGTTETEVSEGLFIIDEKDTSKELMSANMAADYRKFYDKMQGSSTYDPNAHNQAVRGKVLKLQGSSTYDPNAHNQAVRGKVLKLQGSDRKNVEITVSSGDFEAIEFAVRAYNKYMNDNAAPGEFSEHVMKMMDMSRMLPEVKTGESS